MLTLAIESSSPQGSLAVHDGKRLLLERSFAAERGASAALFPLLEAVLQEAPPVEQIAVGLGPGSYAGVRIAIAAALGLRMALGCKLVGLPSVAGYPLARYLAIGDARRQTYYWTEVRDGVCLEGPLLLTSGEFESRLTGATLPVFSTDLPHTETGAPTAARLAELASRGLGIVAEGALEPIYLREVHITKPKETPGFAS